MDREIHCSAGLTIVLERLRYELVSPIRLIASKLTRIGKRPAQVQGDVRYWADSPTGDPVGLGVRGQVTLLFPKRIISTMTQAKFTVPYLAALMLAGLLGSPSAKAADLPDDIGPQIAAEREWMYEITPYFWAPGLKGDVAVFGPPAPTVGVDVKFHELFDAIDWSEFPPVFMGYGEMRNDRFGVFADLIHFALAVDGNTPGPVFSSVDLKLKATIATAAGSYRIIEAAESHLDVLAGARLWSVDSRLAFGAGLLPALSVSDDETWVDPVIGVKGQHGLNERFFVKGWGMIGGFGASSDFMWDVFGGLGYQVNDRFSTTLGWRHIGVDYSKGSFLFDVDIDGPMIEGSFKF